MTTSVCMMENGSKDVGMDLERQNLPTVMCTRVNSSVIESMAMVSTHGLMEKSIGAIAIKTNGTEMGPSHGLMDLHM